MILIVAILLKILNKIKYNIILHFHPRSSLARKVREGGARWFLILH